MKTFKVTSYHNVFIDNYKQGEGEHVNSYLIKATIDAENVNDAILQYFKKTLYYSFEFKHAYVDDDCNNVLHYSNLVDVDNEEASANEIAKWKQNKLVLYSNNIQVEVHELIQQKIVI